MQVQPNNTQVFLLNGWQIEILEKQKERGMIITYSGIQKPEEQNVLIIEINSNATLQGQLLVYDQVLYEYYKEKLQFTFLKTKNYCLYQLCEHQLMFWHEYFKKQEFKILPLQQKHSIFRKVFINVENQYCRKNLKQKTYDLCLFLQDQLGNKQIKGIDYRLFRDNDMDPLNVDINQGQLNIESIRNFGNLYFQILTDIDSYLLNQITEDQRIHIITQSPLYEWQKQEIINFLYPAFVQELTIEQLLKLLKEDHFDIGTYSNQQSNQYTEIIYQYSLQQQQIQSQLNYLYHHTKEMENNQAIYQEYQYLNKFNAEFQISIQNGLSVGSFSSKLEDIFKQQLDELNRLSYQFYLNLRQTLCEDLMTKHKALELKLNTLYEPTQYIGQFGSLQTNLYSKLQHQNKMVIQNIEEQSHVKLINDVPSILQFNESLNKLNQLSQNIKADYKDYKKQLVTQLVQIKPLLETNLRRIQKKFQHLNIKYLMMVINQDESDQASFVANILESQQFLKKIIKNLRNEIPNVIFKQNSNIDILNTIQSYQELECRIGSLNIILEEKQQEVLQFEQVYEMKRQIFLNELCLRNQKQLEELKQECKSQFQSIKQFLIKFSKYKNLISDQELKQRENRIELIVQKQFYRFSIIEELSQQNQINKQYYKSVSKKIEEERNMMQSLVNQELTVFNELFKNNYYKQDDLQEQEILDFELTLLIKQYNNVKCELEQEIQNIQQQFSRLETAFQEQLLLQNKIKILCQENQDSSQEEGTSRRFNHFKQMDKKITELIKKIKDKFEENTIRFLQFFHFFKEVKANIDLQQDQERLCFEIEQQLILIQEQVQIIQNKNTTKSRDEKRMEYQQLRSQLELIQKEAILKGKQTGFNSQGYYQQFMLIIMSKFYHMNRFYQRLMQAKALNSNQLIDIEDLELLNSQKDEYQQLESQVDYYKKAVIENGAQAFQMENLQEKLEDLEKQIELKRNYLLSVIKCSIRQHLKKSLKSTQMIDKIEKFTNFLEFSQFLPLQLLCQVR